MLDENLPAFFLKPSSTGIKHHREFHLSHHGSEPAPAYLLQHADPASPSLAHKNCYAAALFDAYSPEVLFGEVLARPAWTEAGKVGPDGGVPPPPQPILPNEFTVQLYNPDQQVKVEVKSKWAGSDTYEFSMPQDVFRTPSASNLDKGQSDPASLEVTPRINFMWRKDGRLSKDLTCYMTGRSTDKKKKSSRKDPDVAIGLWRQMRELTIYEPNLARVDMEDPKGLEVCLLLSAVVIKDLYFSTKDQMRDQFNITDGAPTARKLSAGGRKLSNPTTVYGAVGAVPNGYGQPGRQAPPTPNQIKRNSLPRLQTTPPASSGARPPPMADPRAQWELGAETARLKAQAESEAREAQRMRREKDKADELERRRLQKMVEEEDKEAQRRQAEIDRETERLRQMYGVQPVAQPPQPPRPQPNTSSSRQSRPSGSYLQPIPQGRQPQPRVGSNGLYVQPSASASSVMMSGANTGSSLNVAGGSRPTKKKSFFGLRSHSDDAGQPRTLAKKKSAVW